MLSLARTRIARPFQTFLPAYSTIHANDPKPDTSKRRQWREDLATPSEASVKADHDTTSMDEMQKRTVDCAQSHHHPDPEAQTHATYARDQVNGPLGHAGVGEFEGIVGSDDLGPDAAQVESDGRIVTRRVTRDTKEGGQANV